MLHTIRRMVSSSRLIFYLSLSSTAPHLCELTNPSHIVEGPRSYFRFFLAGLAMASAGLVALCS